MSLSEVPLDHLTAADIQRLIDNKTQESALIDFKSQTYLKGSPDFACDACAFANGRGGDIIIGIEEQGGEAVAIKAFVGDADDETLRLTNSARDLIEPRLIGMHLRAVPMAPGSYVIVARIRKSFTGPHRVKVQGRGRFLVRSSAGNAEPDLTELRHLFVEAPLLVDQVRVFRNQRIARVITNDLPVALAPGPIVLSHVVSLSAFGDRRLTDVVEVLQNGTHMPLPPTGASTANTNRINLDGVVTYPHSGHPEVKGYAQLFRNGAIEGAATPMLVGDRVIHGMALANMIVSTIKQHAATLRDLDAGDPLFAFATLCHARGARLAARAIGLASQTYASEAYPVDLIDLPEVQLSDIESETPMLMRQALTMIWNAFGVAKCEAYDAIGNWIGATGTHD